MHLDVVAVLTRDTELLRGLLRVEDSWDVIESMLDLERSRVDVRLEWKGPGRCPSCGRVPEARSPRTNLARPRSLRGSTVLARARAARRLRRARRRHGRCAMVGGPLGINRALRTQHDRAHLRDVGGGGFSPHGGELESSRCDHDACRRARPDSATAAARQASRHRREGNQEGSCYFSLVSDLDAGVVLFVGHGRKRATIDAFWAGLTRERLAAVEGVAMAMWQPYFDSTMAYIPDAAGKIVFDRFHVTASYEGRRSHASCDDARPEP